MKPLILITNDDGVTAKGLRALDEVAMEFGDVVVMAPEYNASGLSHSITSSRPLRVREVKQADGLSVYCCDGTPVDCVKLAVEYFCPRRPDVVLSGINHGSNSSINVLYSGTMGAVIEATALGMDAIGFSLLHHTSARLRNQRHPHLPRGSRPMERQFRETCRPAGPPLLVAHGQIRMRQSPRDQRRMGPPQRLRLGGTHPSRLHPLFRHRRT